MRGHYGPNRPYTAPLWPVLVLVIVIGAAGAAGVMWAVSWAGPAVAAHKGPVLAGVAAIGWAAWASRPRKRGRRR